MGELVISYATANDWITCRLSAILCLDFHDCFGKFFVKKYTSITSCLFTFRFGIHRGVLKHQLNSFFQSSNDAFHSHVDYWPLCLLLWGSLSFPCSLEQPIRPLRSFENHPL